MSSSIKMLNMYSATNDYSTLFNSLSGGKNNSSSNSIFGSASFDTGLLSDYASIKNGSYSKLTKAYYAKNSGAEEKSDAVSNLMSKSRNLQYTSAKGEADKLGESLNKLASEDLFAKVKKKDENGNETEDYDFDKISSAVKAFVKDYNALVKSGGDSDNNSILRSTLSMVQTTNVNSKLLDKVGISVGFDNKLSLDEDALKKADVASLKTLFSGIGSYGDTIENKTSEISRFANNAVNSLAGYNSSGALGNLGSGIYNQFY